ncbi:SDR family oxidoreductase [Paenibacillus sp. GCM10023250]|uniref:SDR family oxidoreductase n=1 Tax=Paenibacillus sp. GCM10023250 TaxID=3252648 RepID=UPI00361D5015
MKLLVTGATGKLGAKVVEALLETVPAANVAVSVRNPEKAERFRARGVDVRQGDFERSETLDAAFAGIDRILIISADGDNETRIRQHTNAVEAAARAGVKFIAYTSLANARDSALFLAPPHQAAEKAILATGIPYAILRNNWYLENELGSIRAAKAGAPWLTAAGSGRTGWAARQDYAEAAAAVLTGEGHENAVYELSGPLLTQDELASAVGAALGKNVPVTHVDDAAYEAAMLDAGVPDFVVPILVEIQRGIREGSLEIANSDFEKVLGRPVTPIDQALRQLAAELNG